MNSYKKSASTPQPKGIRKSRHTNSRALRKRMDRRDRRKLNRQASWELG